MQQFCKVKSSYKVPDTDVRSGGGGGGGKKGGGQVVANVQFGGLQFCQMCVGMLPMTNCVLWSCHKMHCDTSNKQLVCQTIIFLMFSSALAHPISLLWTKMHEVFSSRMETARTCFTKTVLFTVWNGQVIRTVLFYPFAIFLLLVTRTWTWPLETQPPSLTCSSWCLGCTCWWPQWCWSTFWLPWCQTLTRESR